MFRRTFLLGAALAMGVSLLPGARATAFSGEAEPQPIRVGVQATGTAQWEMKIIKSRKLDRENGVHLILKDVAGKQAGHVALMANDVDIILSDYVWVASLRAAGEDMVAVPHSLAVGGLIVPPDSPIKSVRDLPGKKIGIAGGPIDKSWIALQAYYAKETGETLADKVEARFGAPPLVNELLAKGDIDAALNFWHFNARSKAAGMTELISVADMMKGMGITDQPPLLAWVFREETARKKKKQINGFLKASFAAKKILATDDAAWEELRPMMGVGDDDALFRQLRDDYRAGIIESYDDKSIAAAEAAFNIMAQYGGAELVGDSKTMADGTFWTGYTN